MKTKFLILSGLFILILTAVANSPMVAASPAPPVIANPLPNEVPAQPVITSYTIEPSAPQIVSIQPAVDPICNHLMKAKEGLQAARYYGYVGQENAPN